MGIADTEQKIIEELKEHSQEEPTDTKPAEELLEEIQQEKPPVEEEATEETQEETTEGEAEEEEEEAYKEIEEPEEEAEEELTGAKFRHKLKTEKEARVKIERESQELRERLARLEGRAEAPPARAAETEPAEEIPDKEYEPEKYAIWKADKLEQKMQAMEATQTRMNAERQWETMQSEHGKSNADYNNAKAFLIESETTKIKQQYPYATDAQISEHLRQQEHVTVGNAVRSGIDPLQQIEFLAFQAGYRATQEEKTPAEAPKKKPNIKNIKKNSKKNASLIGGSSAGDTGDARSAQQLLAMSIDDIHKFGAAKFEKAIKKLEARG